ncbi:MAG: c-type cytochrome [Sulfurovum sp.]|nr:c-type cytochrome [Sulfurovum sp.]
MFKSYRKLLSTVAIVALASVSVASAGNASRTYENGKKVIDGGMTYPTKNGMTSVYKVNTQKNYKDVKFGRPATPNEIKAWDIDVMPDGTGLPEGKGSVEEGDEIYEAKCASCHFDFGSGGAGYPALQQGNAYEAKETLKLQRLNPEDDGPQRNFGSYWPQASTAWWYIKTGMPHPAPLSLTDDETYALMAYMLAINEITIDGEELEDEYVLDREKFLKIVMPNKDGFVPVIDGKDGLENVRKFYDDAKNFGGIKKRCMKNCFDGEPKVARIQGVGISDFNPPLSAKKEKPAKKESTGGNKAKEAYDASCAVCHATDAMGAPAVGDKKAWEATLKKGLDVVKKNAIVGINGMPPKGGANLTDDEMNAIVDYMIEASK